MRRGLRAEACLLECWIHVMLKIKKTMMMHVFVVVGWSMAYVMGYRSIWEEVAVGSRWPKVAAPAAWLIKARARARALGRSMVSKW